MKKIKIIIILVMGAIFLIASIVIMTGRIKFNKTIDFLGENNIRILYSSSASFSARLDVYFDKKGNQYIFEKNFLVGYIKNNSVDDSSENLLNTNLEKSDKELDETELENKAYEYFVELIADKKRIETYKLKSKNHAESSDEYRYTFTKYVAKYKTNDFISIEVDSLGKLLSYIAQNQGEFDDIDIVNVSEEKLEAFVKDKVQSKYGNVKYEIEDYVIDIVDKNPKFKIYVGIYPEGYNTTEILIYNF